MGRDVSARRRRLPRAVPVLSRDFAGPAGPVHRARRSFPQALTGLGRSGVRCWSVDGVSRRRHAGDVRERSGGVMGDERGCGRGGPAAAARSRGSPPGAGRAPVPKQEGKALRERVPRVGARRAAVRPAGRPDAVAAVEESNRGRMPELTPIRVGRMAATPFAFLRGSAGLMAHDLAGTPVTGVGAQICGDAHAANFGLYGDARGGLVIDLNDFDETVARAVGVGPEAARGLAGAGRAGGRGGRGHLPRRPRTTRWAPTGARCGCWPSCRRWTRGTPSRTRSSSRTPTPATCSARWSGSPRRRGGNTSARFAAKVDGGGRRDGSAAARASSTRRRCCGGCRTRRRRRSRRRSAEYLGTLSEDRLPLLARYAVHDVAFRVVGTGSVGTRSYVVLLLDHRGEPLVLQVKEARPSALLPHLAAAGFDGARGRPRGAPGGARPEADAGRQRHPARLDDGATGGRSRYGSSATARAASTRRRWPPTRSTTTAG